MAFLQPDILPAMAEAIHRQLRAARGARLKRDALEASIVPAATGRGSGGLKLFTDTLRELSVIEAVAVTDDEVRLPDSPNAREPDQMARLVCERAMTAELETDLWEKDDAGSLVLLGARDLVRALAWFLNLNVTEGPFDFEATNPKISELQEHQTGERPIFNVERWRPFVRWGRYLGFLSDVSLYSGSGTSVATVLPDPTRAMRHALTKILSREWMPMDSVLPALAQELPVLDGGVYRRAMYERGVPDWDTDCSPSLTLGFLRLKSLGVIELQVGAGDAPKATFANNQGAFHAVRLVGS
jgi:hypothetical protein